MPESPANPVVPGGAGDSSAPAGRPVRWIRLGEERIAELQPAPARSLPRKPALPSSRSSGSSGSHDSHGPSGERGSADTGPGVARVVGPGRIERGYQERIGELERTVEMAALVERGSARLLDRVEGDLARERETLRDTRQQANRLLVSLGALQRENEALRERVLQLEGGAPPAIEAAERTAGPARIGTRARARHKRGASASEAPGRGFWGLFRRGRSSRS